MFMNIIHALELYMYFYISQMHETRVTMTSNTYDCWKVYNRSPRFRTYFTLRQNHEKFHYFAERAIKTYKYSELYGENKM